MLAFSLLMRWSSTCNSTGPDTSDGSLFRHPHKSQQMRSSICWLVLAARKGLPLLGQTKPVLDPGCWIDVQCTSGHDPYNLENHHLHLTEQGP